MDIDTEGWNLSDWKRYALAVRKAHQIALDGWENTVTELEAQSKLVLELVETTRTLRNYIALLQSKAVSIPFQSDSKRSRGRPKKHGEFNFAEWYDDDCLPKYKAQHHGRSAGTQKVLTWYFQQVFKDGGLRTSKVMSPEYQARLKTMVNIISDQRNPLRSATS